jgi:hypothetical protein
MLSRTDLTPLITVFYQNDFVLHRTLLLTSRHELWKHLPRGLLGAPEVLGDERATEGWLELDEVKSFRLGWVR